MGLACCKAAAQDEQDTFSTRVKNFKKPRWRSDEPLSEGKLKAMREEFWDTEPHYGGDRVIWDALRAACEADIHTARTIVESAGIIVTTEDMTVCYDERGRKYDLPKYVVSDPTNLVKGGSSRGDAAGKKPSTRSAQLELPVVVSQT